MTYALFVLLSCFGSDEEPESRTEVNDFCHNYGLFAGARQPGLALLRTLAADFVCPIPDIEEGMGMP